MAELICLIREARIILKKFRPYKERLDDLCKDQGIRLIYLFRHLRSDALELSGGSDSTTVFMRMGNSKEAAMAAEFIGRGYKFVMNGYSENESVFEVERTALQNLDEMALLLVEKGLSDKGRPMQLGQKSGRQRVQIGYCDPDLLLRPRASSDPLPNWEDGDR